MQLRVFELSVLVSTLLATSLANPVINSDGPLVPEIIVPNVTPTPKVKLEDGNSGRLASMFSVATSTAMISSLPSPVQPQEAVLTPTPMEPSTVGLHQLDGCGTVGHISGCVGPSGASYTFPGGSVGFGPSPSTTVTKVVQSSMDFTSTEPLNGPTATVIVSGASKLGSEEISLTSVALIVGLTAMGAVRGLM